MSTVYFLDLRKKYKSNFISLFRKLVTESDGLSILKKKESCAVKAHFGEDGNVNFVRPVYYRCLTDMMRKAGSRPYLTDTTTLYSGRRFRGDTHLELAKDHGFDFVPVVIADGLYGVEYEKINNSRVARLFTVIDRFVCVSHFKGHLTCGFGGALKNVGMGCASKGGKLHMHSLSKPRIDMETCTRCLKCYEYCAYQAVKKGTKKMTIDHKMCTGCCGCMSICPERAIKFSWDAASTDTQKGIAQYTADIVNDKKVFYINFLIDITPNCDCFHTNEPAIAPDVGIFCSYDPVAIDQACYDMVRKEIDQLHPDIDPQEQLSFAQKFGAGERKYEIKTISA
jgi:uncharacterized Fe-S center protein